MAFERTLVLVKPHAVAERWTNQIFERYLEAGLTFGDMQVLTLKREEAAAFYAEHEGKDFFDGLLDAMCAGPIVAMIWVGEDAIQQVRDLNGATNPEKA
jgi:nucleoside-diphosphate kinase